MKNILDADNVTMEARDAVERADEQFKREWYKPVVDTMMAMAWQNLPDAAKAMVSSRVSPEAMKAFSEKYG